MELEVQRNEQPQVGVAAKNDDCELELMELGSEARKLKFSRGEKLGDIFRRHGVDVGGKVVQQNTVTVANPDAEEALPDSYVVIVGEVHNG